ncbi:MAG TPA: metallophosphoesterase [Candidatus Lumbricidophila sp.]|nr:metallophosphoesterase [Candidatus Lumbricidophila sp.]
MQIFEHTPHLNLPDARVFVAGDWHSNSTWAEHMLQTMVSHDSSIRTVLHLGDFWPTEQFLQTIDRTAARSNIDRVLFIPGNHEPWPQLMQIEEDLVPGEVARISEAVWFLPRPFRFSVGGQRVLALGGAASVDAPWRTPGIDWWPEERITDKHVEVAISGGQADIMLTHDSPVSAVPAVQKILANKSSWVRFKENALSAAQRERVETVWQTVQPKLLMHGHMHVYDERHFSDGRRVLALAPDGATGNAVVLNLEDLSTELISTRL